MSRFLFGYDFYYEWCAGSLLRKGQNPYDMQTYARGLSEIGWPASEALQRLTHPPSSLWLYWLFARLPFACALWAWTVISVCGALLCSVVLWRHVSVNQNQAHRLVYFSALVFPPILSNVIWGQVNVVLLFGMTVFSWSMARGSHFAAGLGFSLLGFKPHLFVPLLVCVVVGELACRRYRLIVGAILGVLAQCALVYLLIPDVFSWYWEALPATLNQSMAICGPTLGQMLECETSWKVGRYIVLGAGVVCGLWALRKYGYSPRTLLCLVMPISVVVSPYAWHHTFIVLLPAFLRVVSFLQRVVSEKALIIGMTVFAALSLPLIVDARIQYVWILLPVSLLFANIRCMRIEAHGRAITSQKGCSGL